jgi:hypothetical protein
MDVRLFDDAGLFAQQAGAYFEVDPFSASVIAVNVAGVVAGVRSQGPADMWATVVEDGEVVGVAMHTPPHKLFLARMPSRAAVALAETLARASRLLPGVSGELTATGDEQPVRCLHASAKVATEPHGSSHRRRCRTCGSLHRPVQPDFQRHLPDHRLPGRPRRRRA